MRRSRGPNTAERQAERAAAAALAAALTCPKCHASGRAVRLSVDRVVRDTYRIIGTIGSRLLASNEWRRDDTSSPLGCSLACDQCGTRWRLPEHTSAEQERPALSLHNLHAAGGLAILPDGSTEPVAMDDDGTPSDPWEGWPET